ncbi:MAG: protein kinase, partial [Lachnospiraceae bacterium]|nr:protein kinase [Lachnospiraceae bacterium]
LGQGGFGITYVGYDLNMESKIAIKEYFPVELVSRDTTTMHGDRVLSLSGEKSITYKAGLKKYVAEAQNVSQFSEVPGVVSVKDFFYANETAYIVMEYIDGISLKDYLKEKGGRLTEEETLAIMKPVLEALVQVHKSGIIHRDISPDNIMLTFEGSGHNKIQSVKLIDFGAARMTAKNDQKSLTIILKHGYAPEEQYRTHGEQGPWTDVYALSAVLYRMLTGETPVPAMDRMFKDEMKKLEQCGVKVSANTAAAILKGLAVKKDDRIQSVQELIGALYEGAKIKNTAGVGRNNSKKIGLFAGIGVAATAACVAGVMFFGGNQSDSVPKKQETVVLADETRAAEETIGSNHGCSTEQGEFLLDMNVQEDELGEQIVFYKPTGSITTSMQDHMLFCMPDGTVKARGSNRYGQCRIEDWDHVVAVAANAFGSFGLREDGTVLYAGAEEYGFEQVELWNGIISIQAAEWIAVGLKEDGTVVSAHNGSEQEMAAEIDTWENIKSIAAIAGSVYGLTEDGAVLCAGNDWIITDGLDWSDVEELVTCNSYAEERYLYGLCEDGTIRTQVPEYADYLGEEYFENLNNVKGITQIGGAVFVKEDGTLWSDTYGIDRNETGQWSNLFSAAISSHTGGTVVYGITKDGELLEYGFSNGNALLEEMQDIRWARIQEGNSIVAYTNDDQLLVDGVNNSLIVYDWIQIPANKAGEQFQDCAGRSYIDGDGNARIIVELDRMEEVDCIPGVKYMVEVWNGIRQRKPGCVYVMLMEDNSVQTYVYGDMQDKDLSDLSMYYEQVAGAENWKNVIQLTDYSHETSGIYGLLEDGTVWESRRNTQADTGDKKIVQLCTNRVGDTLGLTEEGTIVVITQSDNFENNGMHQAELWEGIVQVAVGESYVAGLRADGTVIAVGQNYMGQCDVEEWTGVAKIIAGDTCTIGIKKDGSLLVAGRLY